ncbi:hypothetical protein Tco_0312070, partial [Tanacetum coccineum]
KEAKNILVLGLPEEVYQTTDAAKSANEMEDVKRMRLAHKQQQLELVPNELIQFVQSLLPPKDAARTSVLSSWLHAVAI